MARETIGERGKRTILNGTEGTLKNKRFLGAVQVIGPAHLENPLFDGPSGVIKDLGREESLLWLKGDVGAQILAPEVRFCKWHAGIYITASNFLILNQNVHDNGLDAPASEANLCHGIYWASGRGGIVIGGKNWRNRARGMQLYPDVSDGLVRGVEVTENTTGVQFGENAARNILEEMFIHHNLKYGVRSYDLAGQGNGIRDSHVWSNPTNLDGTGYDIDNVVQMAP